MTLRIAALASTIRPAVRLPYWHPPRRHSRCCSGRMRMALLQQRARLCIPVGAARVGAGAPLSQGCTQAVEGAAHARRDGAQDGDSGFGCACCAVRALLADDDHLEGLQLQLRPS
jgi:hypothetical protein